MGRIFACLALLGHAGSMRSAFPSGFWSFKALARLPLVREFVQWRDSSNPFALVPRLRARTGACGKTVPVSSTSCFGHRRVRAPVNDGTDIGVKLHAACPYSPKGLRSFADTQSLRPSRAAPESRLGFARAPRGQTQVDWITDKPPNRL